MNSTEVNLSTRPIGSYGEDKLQRLFAYYKRLDFEVIEYYLTVAHMKSKNSE